MKYIDINYYHDINKSISDDKIPSYISKRKFKYNNTMLYQLYLLQYLEISTIQISTDL